jgi:hypothetical protein
VTGPAAPPLPAELDALLRRMRLPCLRKAAPGVLATARAQRREPAEVLRVLLAEEVTGRDAPTRRMRRKIAGFPSGKTFSSWQPEEPSISAATQDAPATLEWIGRAENLVIAGPSVIRRLNFSAACFPRSGRCCDRCDDVRWLRAARSSRAGSVRAGVPGSRRGLARGLPAVRGLPGGVVS